MTRKSRLYKSLDYVDPAPVSQMTRVGRPNTVCDVLRKIYSLGNEEVRLLARIATTMTRKMDYRLAEYAGGAEMKNKERRKLTNKYKRRNSNKAKRRAAEKKRAN